LGCRNAELCRVHPVHIRQSVALHWQEGWSTPDLLTSSLPRPVSRPGRDRCLVRHDHWQHYPQIFSPHLSRKEHRFATIHRESFEKQMSNVMVDSILQKSVTHEERTGDLFHAIATTIIISITYIGFRGLPNT
jgi:hypothetical protein